MIQFITNYLLLGVALQAMFFYRGRKGIFASIYAQCGHIYSAQFVAAISAIPYLLLVPVWPYSLIMRLLDGGFNFGIKIGSGKLGITLYAVSYMVGVSATFAKMELPKYSMEIFALFVGLNVAYYSRENIEFMNAPPGVSGKYV